MASHKQKPVQTAFEHQESNTPTEYSLTALDDALLAHIISFLRWGNRRQLRAVCHRFKALVDQQITKIEMDLGIFSEDENCDLVKKAALLWPGTRFVEIKPGDDESVSPAVVKALADCEWPKLEIIKLGGVRSDTDSAAALAGSRGFPALRELHFTSEQGGGLSTDGIEALSKKLCWATLEVLMLGVVAIGLNGGQLLASMSHVMPALRSLSLHQSRMTDANLKDFCEGSWPSLEILDLSENALGPESGASLAEASKKWGKLRQLDITRIKLADTGLQHLLQGHWPCLKKLGLGFNGLDVRAGALLADASQQLPSLREIDLSWNDIKDRGICALLESHWPLLESLNLYETGAGIGALSALVAASHRCPNIRELYFIHFNKLEVNGLGRLERGSWDSVTKLEVSFNPDTNRALNGMVARKVVDIMSSRLPSLKDLCLCNCDLGISGLEVVLHGQWRNLEILKLTDSALRNEGAVFLAEASLNVLSGIKYLGLSGNKLKDAGIEYLMKGNWPNLETLNISLTGMVGSHGAKAVAAAALRLPNLRKLRVEGNHIDGAGSMALVEADWGMMKEMFMTVPRPQSWGGMHRSTPEELHEMNAGVQKMKAAAFRGGFKMLF